MRLQRTVTQQLKYLYLYNHFLRNVWLEKVNYISLRDINILYNIGHKNLILEIGYATALFFANSVLFAKKYIL